MPASKGRKKGRGRERARVSDIGAPRSASPAEELEAPVQQRVEVRMPSPMARISGAVLAALTGGIAIYMITNGLSDESATAGLARIVGGAVMVVIAIVVGILSVAPEVVLRVFGRR